MDNQGENQVNVTLNQPARVLHFSDGVHEEIEEEKAVELKRAPSESNVDPKKLSWGPWLSHYASKSGNKVLNVVDSAGESLANLFGIITPKYQIEIDEFQRIQEDKRKMEEESAGWVPKNAGGDIPLVLNEPLKMEKSGEV